jgi:radical SAM superfamily enzyme YgiQ (UPF0313 family)
MLAKKYLLISPPNPKTISQTSNKTVENTAMFPVGIAYISAAMKREMFNVQTLNGSFAGPDFEQHLNAVITAGKIDIVCVGGQSIDIHGIQMVIEVARSANPDVIIVTGGAIVSADPYTAMQVLRADIGVIGEGEEAMCELAHALDNDMPISEVPGLIYRENGMFIKTTTRPEVKDLDALPMMDFEGFSYREWLALNSNAGIIFTARSCPFKCTFCFKSTGNQYRSRSLDSVFDEIDCQIATYGITALNISDELFAAKKQRVIEFCERIRPYGLSWVCSLRIPEIVKDLLPLMKEAGCTTIGTGLESASPQILSSMRKKITLEQIEKAINTFGDTGMVMLGNLIFGDVLETKETYRESIDFWHQHRDNIYINLGTIIVLPGTHLYDHACSVGLITDKEQYLRDGQFICNVSKLSNEEYFEMLSETTELSFLPQVSAKTVEIRDFDAEGVCNTEWTCRRCGKMHGKQPVHFLQAEICLCSCGVQNTVEPFRAIIINSDVLTANLQTGIDYVFWGVGSQYCRLVRFFGNSMKSDHFIQVDSSKHHQQMTRLGKRIYGPDVINEQNISNVIITSPMAKGSITSAIRSRYPAVTNIYFPALKSCGGRYLCSFERI